MLIYNILINLYAILIKFAALWVPKAKLWSDGRANLFERMAKAIPSDERILWIHVSSLGEFEQGRPLIEKIRKERAEYKILLTFFSPSGYELRKDYKGVDYIFYLPIDTPRNAKRFLDIAHPEVAIFVKYEFWLNMLFELGRRSIRTYIVSAIFRQNSIFFRSYGFYWRRALKSFTTLFVQNQESKELLSGIGIDRVVVAGDTRFDRVASIASSNKRNDIIERFKGEAPLFIAGSTWPADEQVLIPLIEQNPGIKFVIAPHEIESARVEALLAKLNNAARYTNIDNDTELENTHIIVLDTMGQLSSIYNYASWAYIGGGFGVGIHNTLEASTFGLPMAFGPNYERFKEARDMVELGACRPIKDLQELEEWFAPLRDNAEHLAAISSITKGYTQRNIGASKRITESIFTA